MNQKDNIYNRLITELLISSAANASSSSSSSTSSSSGATRLELELSTPTSVPASTSSTGNVITSTVTNVPAGYSVQTDSHAITLATGTLTPSGPSSAESFSGSFNYSLGAAGSSFLISSTVNLTHASNPTITLTATLLIRAVEPAYIGVKPDPVALSTTGLTKIASDAKEFTLTITVYGRLYIIFPTTTPAIPDLVSITDNNGLVIPISEFDKTVQGGDTFYVSKYNTQFTGPNQKTFKFNFA